MDVSVLLCFKNSGELLVPTLEHLKNQVTPCSWELIAVDNGSTDHSAAILTAELEDASFPFQLLEEKYPGKQAALLTGTKAAKGSIIIICDDDNLFNPDYIQSAFDLANELPEIGAFGGYGNLPDSDFPTWLDEVKLKYALGPQLKGDGVVPALQPLWGAGMVIRRRLMIPLIEEKFPFISLDYPVNSLRNGEDYELSLLFHLLDIPMFYSDRLQFKHNIHSNRINHEAHLDLIKRQNRAYQEIYPYYALLYRWENKSMLRKICSAAVGMLPWKQLTTDQPKALLQLLLSPRGKRSLHSRTRAIQQLKRNLNAV